MRPRREEGPEETWSDAAVVRESARWVHVPSAGVRVESGERLLVLLPPREGPSRVWRSRPDNPATAGDLITQTTREARAAGASRLVWHTGEAVAPPFMDDLLPEHGFRKTEELTVLAFELGADPEPRLPNLGVPPEIRVELVETPADLRRAHAVSARVFASTPDEPDVASYLLGLAALADETPRPPGAAPRAFRCLASLPDSEGAGVRKDVAAAGAEISDRTLRLWGAGTLPEHRGRGAYRALVRERCRLAHAFGAALALTKANASSSAPILQAAGFRPVAREARYTLELPPDPDQTPP